MIKRRIFYEENVKTNTDQTTYSDIVDSLICIFPKIKIGYLIMVIN